LRLTNVALLLGIAIATFLAYLVIEALAKLLGMPDSATRFDSYTAAVLTLIVPRVAIICAALIGSGAILFYFLNSEVPLKWCVALGLIYAVGYFSLNPSVTSCIISLGMLISPIYGGYQAKRISLRRRGRGPN